MGNSIVSPKACTGSCFRTSESKNNDKVAGLVKMEIIKGQELKRILVNLPGFGTCLTGKDWQPLLENREAKSGDTDKSVCSIDGSRSGVMAAGGRRIKLVITKQQLQLLLAKQISVEQVISEFRRTTLASFDAKWKPRLESVPEGDEPYFDPL